MYHSIKVKDHSISQEEFQLVYDKELDYYITQPVPKNLDKYYESDIYISHTDASKSLSDKLYQFVKKINLKNKIKLLAPYKNKSNRLLDIGAGTGDFLIQSAKNGWYVSGVEPNQQARTLAKQKGIKLFSSLEELGNEKFNVITLWHVLEHLPNLENQIQKITTLLEPNGTLVIAVPNFKSYDAQIYGTTWAAFDVPRHLYHFSRNSINRLFSKYNLQLLGTEPMLFDAYYVSLLSEQYTTGTKNYIKAFFIGFISNLKAIVSKEHSSIIYLLKKH